MNFTDRYQTDEETRIEVVELYRKGWPVRFLANAYGVAVPTIYQWIKAIDGHTTPRLLQRVQDLEKRIALLEMQS